MNLIRLLLNSLVSITHEEVECQAARMLSIWHALYACSRMYERKHMDGSSS